MGGMALHNGKISEMRTGEGKTLTGTLALYLNALPGRGTATPIVWGDRIFTVTALTAGLFYFSPSALLEVALELWL